MKLKFGYVTVTPVGDDVYQFGCPDSQTPGRYIRQRIRATSQGQVKSIAEKLNRLFLQGVGIVKRGDDQGAGVSISEALLLCIQNSGAGNKTKHDYRNSANIFLRWLKESRTDRHTSMLWGKLLPMHIESYARDLKAKGLSFERIRNLLYIVRATSRFMADNWPDQYRDITRKLSIKRESKRTQAIALEWEDVAAIVNHPQCFGRLHALVLCCALCGMRQMEALHLRPADIIIERGVVLIRATPNHRPKTLHSERDIPVPEPLRTALRAAMKDVPHEDYIFKSGRRAMQGWRKGQPWNEAGLSHALRRAFKAVAAASGRSILATFPPRKLRATFSTLARRAEVPDIEKKRYMGHAPDSVMEAHYESITVEDLRTQVVKKFMFRLQKYCKRK